MNQSATIQRDKRENYAKRKTRWGSIIFFASLFLVSAIGIPLHIYLGKFRWIDLALCFVLGACNILAITVGYHRLYSHRAFKTKPWVEWLLLFFGASAIQQSAYKWSALHRQHHTYIDTDADPYSIMRGFFHAHMGWLIFWKYSPDYSMVKDLNQNKRVIHQHKNFDAWAFGAGFVFPMLVGWASGSLAGGFLFLVALRLTLVYQATFCINSVAHTFGTRKYDNTISARDHWVAAVITFGEGYHNYHHKYPYDYRNGVRWFHWDPSKWVIWGLYKLGLASDLKTLKSKPTGATTT